MGVSKSTIRVLVVDDQEANRETQVGLLRAHHVEVEAVASADRALSRLSEARFDVVLTDINLRNRQGDTSGVDLAREIRSSWRNIPVVGYSATIGDLGQRDRRVFSDRYLRADDKAEKLVAGTIRAGSVHALPDVRYPIVDLGVATIYAYRAEEAEITALGYGSWAGQETDVDDDDAAALLVVEPTSAEALRSPLAIEAHADSSGYGVHVPDFPALAGSGASMDEAVEDLVAMMRGFQEDLRDDNEGTLGPHLLQMKRLIDATLD